MAVLDRQMAIASPLDEIHPIVGAFRKAPTWVSHSIENRYKSTLSEKYVAINTIYRFFVVISKLSLKKHLSLVL